MSAGGNEGEEDITSRGFFVQGEYVVALKSWFGFRPYAAFITTSPDNDSERFQDEPNYEITTTAFMAGGKIRLAAPISWIAPYFETGLGFPWDVSEL